MIMSSAGASSQGQRNRNEDSYAIKNKAGIYIVADGMGGHKRGDLASQTLIAETLRLLVPPDKEKQREKTIAPAIINALSTANKSIYHLAAEGDMMGTTAVICVVTERQYHIGWAGDSRAYLQRKGKLTQLTRDHSPVQRLLEAGLITEEEARRHPERNVIDRAVGIEKEVEVDITSGDLRKNDILLLCTDGIHGILDTGDINKILKKKFSLKEKAEKLIEKALDSGGEDNATVVLVQAGENAGN